MTTTQDNVVQIEPNLFAEHARIELELEIAQSIQVKTMQASIWMFNAWGDTDALLDREAFKELIEKFETISVDADDLMIEVAELVKDLREEKRKLTKKLKAKAFSPEAKAEKLKTDDVVIKQTKEIADSYVAAEEAAKKPELTIVKSESVSKSKKT